MSSTNKKLVIRDGTALQEVELSVEMYQAAAANNMSLAAHINQVYAINDDKHGTPFEQLLAQTGMFLHADRNSGIRPPRMSDIVSGKAEMNAGIIVRDAQPASRLLFPAVALEALEDQLIYNAGGYVGEFENLIAVKDDINGARFEQPIISYSKIGTNPGNVVRSQPIAQNSYPVSMTSITTSDVARKIPTFSLGLEISDEALRATSLPLVTMALSRQGELERIARIDEYLQAMMWGDKDMAMAALSAMSINARALDGSITGSTAWDAAGALTHKAWVRWLRRNWRIRHIDYVMCTVGTALQIEARTGRPNYQVQDSDTKLINPMGQVANPMWQDVKIWLVEDGVLPDGVIVGIDSRYAIRRVRNAEAEYAAVEQFVLKKTQAMRFDFGEILYRLFDQAWDVLLLGDTTFPTDPRT
jgi:hypothetical protein